MAISDSIRSRRLELGMTQERLGREAGNRSVNQINGYERGRSRPSRPVLEDIAKALKTTPEELMGTVPTATIASTSVAQAIEDLKTQIAQATGLSAARLKLTIELA